MERPTPDLETYWFRHTEPETFDDLSETFEWEVPETMNLATYLCDRWAAHDGSRVALHAVDGAGEAEAVTYATLRRRSNRLATHLRAEGVGRGDRVAVVAAQRPATLVGFVAAWKIGAIVVPVSPKYGEEAVEYRFRDSGAAACLVGGALLPQVRSVVRDGPPRDPSLDVTLIVTDGSPAAGESDYQRIVTEGDATFDPVETDADDAALLLYTSGTTGDPKGVVHAHHTVLGMAPSYALSRCNADVETTHVAWVPAAWSWIASLSYVLPALFYGHALLGDAAERFDPMRTFEQFEERDVTVAFLPSAALAALREAVDDPAAATRERFRVAMLGGYDEATYAWLRTVFPNAVVHRSYGQTEACLPIGHCSALFAAPDRSIGRAMPGHEVTIRDPDTGERVPSGETGEIAIRSAGNPACLDGYWGLDGAFDEKVHDGWLWTDDLGEMDDAGNVFFHGRIDDVINCSGYRVGPGEVESVLDAHDAVVESGVIGVPDERRGEVPKAFVVLTDGAELTDRLTEELQDRVREQYAVYAYPREVEAIDELPIRRGKLRRADLKEYEGVE